MTGPRGIAVLDVGSTNTKLILFDADLTLLAEEKLPTAHRDGPDYLEIDPEPVLALARRVLPVFDRIRPVDVIVPSTHGSAFALLDAAGSLSLPVMAYASQPPEDIRAAYAAMAPGFAECCCPLNPMALTVGLQFLWQETAHPAAFAATRHILPLAQYLAHRLGGRMANEVTAMGAQTQLWDVPGNRFSTLARSRGWAGRFAPMARAWDRLGQFPGLTGRGDIAAGIHDSNANYLRYLADGRQGFTLLSTGSWIIGFDDRGDVTTLDPARDTASNTDVFGRPVACGRYYGGVELALLAKGAPPTAATVDATARLIAQGTLPLPSFTDSGGPVPGRAGQGRVEGPAPANPEEHASLAALHTALMTVELLDALHATGEVIVDGPFAAHPTWCGLLKALLPGRAVRASTLTDGTAAGAAVLGLMDTTGTLPQRPITLREVPPAPLPDLGPWHRTWRSRACA